MQEIQWHDPQQRYSNGEYGTVRLKKSEVTVATVHWSSLSGDEADTPYVATVKLPGIKKGQRFATMDKAKTWCQRAFSYWVEQMQ